MPEERMNRRFTIGMHSKYINMGNLALAYGAACSNVSINQYNIIVFLNRQRFDWPTFLFVLNHPFVHFPRCRRRLINQIIFNRYDVFRS